jgi:hypothetical protein
MWVVKSIALGRNEQRLGAKLPGRTGKSTKRRHETTMARNDKARNDLHLTLAFKVV